jgi:4-amino-4-deoxy-L-arabinose transferase-like glycosyltransferase
MLILRALTAPSWKLSLLTGLTLGAAAATKYNMALFLFPALLAFTLGPSKKTPIYWWIVVPLGAIAGFLICNPFVGTPEFQQGFLFELRHAQQGGTLAFVNTGSGWAYHLLRGIPTALGYPVLLLVVIGTAMSLRSKSTAVRLSLIWVFFYLFAIGFSKERFIRYLVPITPFLAVLGCVPITTIQKVLFSRLKLKYAVGAVVLFVGMTAVYLLSQLAPLCGIAAQDWAWIFIRSDILESQKVKTIGLVNTPWYYHPPLSPYNAGAFSKKLFEEWNTRSSISVVITGWDVIDLEKQHPDIFILSDLETADMLRLDDLSAKSFMDSLAYNYTNSHSYHSDLFGGFNFALAPPRRFQPPDWLYSTPIITVYSRPRDGNN